MSEALIKAESNGDPNGIRTRVTAVKGRCPGPLDDRVTKRVQYQNCCSFTQGKLPSRSTFILLLLAAQLMNQRCCARRCTLVFAQNFARALDEALARFAVAQKP